MNMQSIGNSPQRKSRHEFPNRVSQDIVTSLRYFAGKATLRSADSILKEPSQKGFSWTPKSPRPSTFGSHSRPIQWIGSTWDIWMDRSPRRATRGTRKSSAHMQVLGKE